MSDDRIRPTWAAITAGCERLYNQYNAQYLNPPDCIVGLTRGGLIPGTIISHLFDKPLIPVSYTSSVGNGSKSMYAKMELHPIDISYEGDQLSVYVIDEICDTGHTLSEVMQYYLSLNYFVNTGVLHRRLDAVHCPTFVDLVLSKTEPWVVYPWEVE